MARRKGRQGQQPQIRDSQVPAGAHDLRDRRFRLRQIHARNRHSLQDPREEAL